MSSEEGVASLAFPDPDSESNGDDPTNFVKPGKGKGDFDNTGDGTDLPYILGTLVVRVVAAMIGSPLRFNSTLFFLLLHILKSDPH